MYHCRLSIYHIGYQNDFIEIMKKAEPPKHFAYEFMQSVAPDGDMASSADVIFADMEGCAAKGQETEDVLNFLSTHKKAETEIILLAGKEQTDALLSQEIIKVADIWQLPMTDREVEFRFGKWQERKMEQTELWLSKNYLDTTINSIPHLIWYKDKEGAHLKVNKSFCQAVNKTMEQIEGRGHYYIWDIEPDDYAKGEFICMESEYEVMEKKRTCVFEENVKIGDEMRKLETYKTPLFDLDGSVMGTVGVAVDVTQERLYEQTILNNANTDFLTNLYNRRYVYQYVEENKNQPFTIFYIDLDNFKSINDIFGHYEGDRALTVTSDTLKASMPLDMIARIGGDEFMIITLGERTEEEIAEKKAWLQEQLDGAFAQHEHFKGISASIGTAYSMYGSGAHIDELVGKADSSMYHEKNRKKKAKQGLNCYAKEK